MARKETVVFSTTTKYGHYEVIDMEYDGRASRVLFSGDKIAAQSGLALDDNPDLLFDYNQRFKEVVESLKPKRVLLVGGGALTLPTALTNAFSKLRVDVVELDDALTEIAAQYFNYEPSERLKIITGDGRVFLDSTSEQYDLILIDAFTHTVIPKSLTSMTAIQAFARHLTPNGSVAINIISSYFGRNAALIQDQYERYDMVFKHVQVFPASRSLVSYWLPQNFVLVASNSKQRLLELRYGALDPPVKVV
jgi:spermidine synthase